VIGPLLEQAVTQARTTPSAEELAAAASHTAYLLGVLRQAGEQLGAPPPHQVLVGLQGLRVWSLQIRDLDGPPDEPVRGRIAGLPTASRAATE
jgi:hypothetical protein